MDTDQKRQKNRRKLIIWSVCGTLLFVVIFPIVYFLGTNDSHHTNFRYLTWKYERAPKDYVWCIHLLTVDSGLLERMKGKPLDELRVWLPETGPAKLGSWQWDFLETIRKEPGVSFEVIGDIGWAIRLNGGKFEYIFPLKG